MKRFALLLGLAAGCTLSGFDDLHLVECRENTKCEPLNMAHGLDVTSAAEVYQCASDHQGCVLGPTDWDDDGARLMGPGPERDCDDSEPSAFPGNQETCDEIDNDCDGVVDEGVYADAQPSAKLGLDTVLHVDFGTLTSSAESNHFDLSVVARNRALDPDDGLQAGPGMLHELGSVEPSSERLLVIAGESDDAPSCLMIDLDGAIATMPCYPHAFASDGSGPLRLAAAVDDLGCEYGRLQLGQVVEGFRVPAAASACGGAYPFVSVEPSEQRCTAREQVLGVSRVELAQLAERSSSAPTQALVGWIGTHELGHDACGRLKNTPVPSDPVDSLSRTSVGVAALGFWVDDQGTLSTTGHEGSAQPELLGFTSGGSAPAIEPVVLPDGSEHYIVAFGSKQGPSLRAIERVATPQTCGEGAAPALSLRSADPWDDAAQTHFAADQLVVAKGPLLQNACGTQRPGVRLGLAWVEGCGSADAELWFASVDFSPSTGFCSPSVPQQASRFDHAALLGQDGARLEPVLGYVERGVLRDAGKGAFVLAWIEGPGRVRSRRVAAEQGTFVDQAIDLGVTGARALGARRLPGGDLELAVVRVANGAAFELVQRRLSGGCGG